MDYKINNKGFTLIELLSVFVILIGVSLVAVGGISSSLEKRDIKECEEQKELAIGAAKIYFSLSDGETNVTILELKEANYINGDNKVNKLSDSDEISISASRDKYIYSGTSCE